MSQVKDEQVGRLIRTCTSDRDAQLRARLRDGDQCRVCARTVDFQDRRSAAGGRYLTRAADVFVVCTAHAAELEASTMDELWEEPEGLLPAPFQPSHSPATIEWVRRTTAEIGSAARLDEVEGTSGVEVSGLTDVVGVGLDLGVHDEVPGISDRDLPIGSRFHQYALRLATRFVVQANRLGALVESRLSRALQQAGDEHVRDGNHGGRPGQVDGGGHGGVSSARDSERTEDGAA